MILPTMLARLYASLARGPGLNARPHRSRQRIDLGELAALGSAPFETALRTLLGPPARALEFPAKVAPFRRPEYPEDEWSEEQKAAARAVDRQNRLLVKLRDIATDATDYFNDHGEDALFLGFPLLSLPASGDPSDAFRQKSLLAPLLLAPLTLRVRLGPRPGVTLEPRGDGADLLVPNPALLAWIEQQTGVNTDDLFADEAGEDPWRELREVLALVGKATGLADAAGAFSAETPLVPVPRADQLPEEPAVLASAVLGLFPLTNPGLIRDTKWMIANEPDLRNPARSFVAPQVLTPAEPATAPPAPEWEPAPAVPRPPAEERFLVTQADPCQTVAVAHARASDALVIHGPPGTGKSQTISNIIGDHLARGERVLFVCDKRTALDVVKFRLDGMGLGGLCGVIHDPQHDRRNLYLGLRERLEGLADAAALPDRGRDLERVSQRVTALQAELRGAFDRLHGTDNTGTSFHDLVGRWLELVGGVSAVVPVAESVTEELLASHRTDAEEILHRAVRTRWSTNPFQHRLGISVGQWLALDPDWAEGQLLEARPLASAADALSSSALPPFVPHEPLAAQVTARRDLAEALAAVVQRNEGELAAALASGMKAGLREALAGLAPEAALLEVPLESDLLLNLGNEVPALAQTNSRIAALVTWEQVGSGWRRLFAWSEKRSATEALAPLALPREPGAITRGLAFYRGLRARWLWHIQRARILGVDAATLAPDAALVGFRDGVAEIQSVHDLLKQDALAPLRPDATVALANLAEAAPVLIANLRRSAEHAAAIDRLVAKLRDSTLFAATALADDVQRWITGEPTATLVESWIVATPTLDDAVRLTERLGAVPAELGDTLIAAASYELAWPDAERTIRAGACAAQIRRRLRSDEALARIDTERIEAAFAELAERTAERQQLVRAHVLHFWDRRVRERLLASTGSRLNPLAAALRTRLLVRGKRALKLRPMIAAGSKIAGGDPLFDLCPVWMASPATVAQIFPREPLFNVIVFDEASQCRLEEALPVLLRGQRVVVAGDPKQLPPTRFFEQGFAESDDTAAETAEEVFEQQQSEAEDLLTAALNLDVQQAYLDVHYRSRHEALIGFSNTTFYGDRLQPVPGHPRNKALRVPIRLIHVDGIYSERGNPAEARATADLVAELLDQATPPSIGVACFNLPQRDLILDALEAKAAADPVLAQRLEAARQRRGRDSFEGLFVKNLENVQGDERDHMIICTTFGPDKAGKFRRNFGALSRQGGERRLNVLVTRAREAVHVLTSIPPTEYRALEGAASEVARTGRHDLYGYLRYAERLADGFEQWQVQVETARRDTKPRCAVLPTARPSFVATALGHRLLEHHGVGTVIHWGNEGFCVDVALTHPILPEDVTLGILTDFNRYRRTPDPIAWELFRTHVLRSQGWTLHRLWTPGIFRDWKRHLEAIEVKHRDQLQEDGDLDRNERPAPH